MKIAIIALLSLAASPAFAEELRIYQTDKYGRIRYSEPSYTVRADGRVIQTDPYGNKQYSKQQYQIKGDRIVPVSALGYRQYSKPALVINGR
jgi:hypothetical protein